jgi:predicted Fe-Mo cluster-binding NifX family protein
MRIAVASQNFRTVTGHAGRTRRWLIYETGDSGTPVEIERLDLPPEMAIRNFADNGSHPLYEVDVVIVGSCGEGFVKRLARHGVIAVPTDESDPRRAIAAYLDGTLRPPRPPVLH